MLLHCNHGLLGFQLSYFSLDLQVNSFVYNRSYIIFHHNKDTEVVHFTWTVAAVRCLCTVKREINALWKICRTYTVIFQRFCRGHYAEHVSLHNYHDHIPRFLTLKIVNYRQSFVSSHSVVMWSFDILVEMMWTIKFCFAWQNMLCEIWKLSHLFGEL